MVVARIGRVFKYEDQGDHPIALVTTLGCMLMQASTLPAACFRLDRVLEKLSERASSKAILATLQATVHRVAATNAEDDLA